MKKRYWIGIACGLTAMLATVILIVCLYNPYNKTEREGWDIYASVDCFVKTEYNKDGNPVKRELYETETLAKILVQHYRYDKNGRLSDFRTDGKGYSKPYYQGARFSVSYNKESNTHSIKPKWDNKEFDAVSISWTDDGKLESEYAKWKAGTYFWFDKSGRVTKELDGGKYLIHHLSDDKKTILVTEEGTLTEIMSVTFDDNGMPKALESPEYSIDYTYTEKKLCNNISIKALGQTVSDVAITYDEKGNPTKREATAKNGDKTVVLALYEYAYDDAGNMTEEVISQADESFVLKEASSGKYAYDKDGNMIEETVGEYTVPGNLLALHNRRYKYDEDGNKIQVDYVKTGPGGTIVKYKSSSRYYADGTKRGSTTYEFYVNWATKEIVDTEYTKDGYVLRQETKKFREGKRVDGVLVDGAIKSKELFESTKDGVPLKSFTEYYNEEGKVTSDLAKTYYQKGKAKVEYHYFLQLDNTFAKGEPYITCTTKTSVTTTYFYTGQIYIQTTREYDEDGSSEITAKVEYDINGDVVSRSTR